MFERSLVNVNVERGLAFTFTRGIPYVASILLDREGFEAPLCLKVE